MQKTYLGYTSALDILKYRQSILNYVSTYSTTETCDINNSIERYIIKYKLDKVEYVRPDPRLIPKNYLWEEDKIFYRSYDSTKDAGFKKHGLTSPSERGCSLMGDDKKKYCMIDYRNRCEDGSSSCVIDTTLSDQYIGGIKKDRDYVSINYDYENYLLEYCKKGFPILDNTCSDSGGVNLIFSFKWKIPEAYIILPKTTNKPNIKLLVDNDLVFVCSLLKTTWSDTYHFKHLIKNTTEEELNKFDIRGKLFSSKERNISSFSKNNDMQVVDSDNCPHGQCPRFKIYKEKNRAWN